MNKSLHNLYLATDEVYPPDINLASIRRISNDGSVPNKSMKTDFLVSGLTFANAVEIDPNVTPSAEGFTTVSLYLKGGDYRNRFLRNKGNIKSTTVTYRNAGGGLVYPAVTNQVQISAVWDDPINPFFRVVVFWFNGVPGPVYYGPYYTTVGVVYNDGYNEELTEFFTWNNGLYYYA